MRNAKHPDHINDVMAAIGALQKKYDLEKYLLVGHSVGATLAMQVALSRAIAWDPGTALKSDIGLPIAILGVAGIYDFPYMVRHVPSGSKAMYSDFTRSAFGGDENVWKAVSPATYDRGTYEKSWSPGQRKLVLVAHSHEDELVAWSQVDRFKAALDGQQGNIELRVIELKGKHQEILDRGEEMAKAITEAISGVAEIGGIDATSPSP